MIDVKDWSFVSGIKHTRICNGNGNKLGWHSEYLFNGRVNPLPLSYQKLREYRLFLVESNKSLSPKTFLEKKRLRDKADLQAKGWLATWFDNPDLQILFGSFRSFRKWASCYGYEFKDVKEMKAHRLKILGAKK